MAFTAREFDASADELFAVISDPETYPDWLVGAADIRDVDHTWPSPGASFHHTVGVRPFAVPDTTEVRDVEPGRSLALSVRARPFLAADVVFRIVGDGDRCVVTIEEELTPDVLAVVLRTVFDPLVHARNHRSLRRLDRVVQRRRAAPVPAASG